MKKNVIAIAFAALTLCACGKDGEPAVKESEAPVVYHLSIQASLDPETKGVTFDGDGMSITTQFEVGDKVYVYNKTKDALARHWDDEEDWYLATPIVLTSGTIQNEGLTCTIQGELSFFHWNSGSMAWEPVTHEDSDAYELYYQMNDANNWNHDHRFYSPRFLYRDQQGSQASASQHDFAIATGVQMTILQDGSLSAQNTARFTNQQSMFRQGLIFKNSKNETVTPTINKLSVGCSKGTLVEGICPTENSGYYGVSSFNINNPDIEDGSVYLSLTFCYPDEDAKNDTFCLTATDDKGNIYACEKNVPAGGFQNGKYYYGESQLTWQEKNNLAMVEASDLGKIIASNGHIYADVVTANIASTAEAMIVYVGSVDGVCEHGLAISLTDAYAYNATYEQATGAVILPTWAAAHPITGGTWRLPSEKDWQYMMWGSYTASPSVTKVNANLCTILDNDKYFWTSDSVDAEKAKAIYFNDTFASVQTLGKEEYYRVRACLAF